MRQLIAALALVVGMAGAPALAADSVDLELVLLADASRSIDDAEIRFQRQGYAVAITHPEVLDAIAQGFEQRVSMTFVEWGDASSQEVVVPWTVVDGPQSAKAFADALLEAPRRAFGPNAIGNALAAAQALIDANAFEGYRKVIDFSGDSAYSFGGMPVAAARERGACRRHRDQRPRHSVPRQGVQRASRCTMTSKRHSPRRSSVGPRASSSRPIATTASPRRCTASSCSRLPARPP